MKVVRTSTKATKSRRPTRQRGRQRAEPNAQESVHPSVPPLSKNAPALATASPRKACQKRDRPRPVVLGLPHGAAEASPFPQYPSTSPRPVAATMTPAIGKVG